MSMDETLLARIDAPPRGLCLVLAAVFVVLFFAVYGAAAHFAALAGGPVAPHADWELDIPLIAWTIVPYFTVDLFYFGAFLIAPTRRVLWVHAVRVMLTVLIAGACFILFPMALAWPRTVVPGPFGWLFDLLYSFDGPHNLVPSLHMALLVLLTELYLRRFAGIARVAFIAWFALIAVSVLTTHQHHLIDVIAGAALGVLVAYLLPLERLPATRRVRQGFIAARYALATAGLAVLLLLLWRWGLWSALLLWPALALALHGLAYAGLGTRIFQKRQGRLSWQARITLAPVLVGQTLWHALCSRRGTRWDVVTDGVLVGRCPTARDARQLLEAGVTAVLDLTSEYSEVRLLRQRVTYLNVPLLDMTVPSRHELRAALTFIRRQVSPPGGRGTVYIHCALGRYRSALIAAEYLRLRDGLTAEEAVGRLRRARKQVVIGPAELEHLHELTDRQRGQTGPNAVSSSA